ncbi:hypothetical protein BM1374165_00499 [Bartonella henselae]|uniref:Uncharacterized protein n=1 Tax=Bartonella henselae TaxID=38323 RepID=X5MF03_BARHN|nr:hypothetical protein BM1374165_00499 [Bartonella henselae]
MRIYIRLRSCDLNLPNAVILDKLYFEKQRVNIVNGV